MSLIAFLIFMNCIAHLLVLRKDIFKRKIGKPFVKKLGLSAFPLTWVIHIFQKISTYIDIFFKPKFIWVRVKATNLVERHSSYLRDRSPVFWENEKKKLNLDPFLLLNVIIPSLFDYTIKWLNCIRPVFIKIL